MIKVGQPQTFNNPGQRTNQEDCVRIPSKQSDPSLFVVCDGVGGNQDGELASKTVCNAFMEYFTLHAAELLKSCEESDFNKALDYVYAQLDAFEPSDMGTTLALAYIGESHCLIAHMGDSRVYHIRPDSTSPLLYCTTDHSYVNYLLKIGDITPEEALNHPARHRIMRALQPGLSRRMKAELHQLDVRGGDYLFLCTDGVTAELEDITLCDILSSSLDNQIKMKQIEQLCADSADNNSACLIPVL